MTHSSVNFDRAAGFYDDTRGFPTVEVNPAIARFRAAADLNEDSILLEVGVGTGRIALPLAAQTGATIVGIDLAAKMLDRLRSKRTTERVHVLVGNISRLPFDDDTFDHIVAAHIFHLVPTWREAIAEAARVLKPGGTLLHGWNGGDDAPWAEAQRSVHNRDARDIGIKFEDRHAFLDKNGWEPVGDEHIHEYGVITTAHKAIDQIERRVWSHTWRMTDGQIIEMIAAMRAAIEDKGIGLEQPLQLRRSFTVRAYRPT